MENCLSSITDNAVGLHEAHLQTTIQGFRVALVIRRKIMDFLDLLKAPITVLDLLCGLAAYLISTFGVVIYRIAVNAYKKSKCVD